MSIADTGAPVAAPDASGRWLHIIAAARALGVTERTIRRRMAARSVQVRRERGRVLVWVSDDDLTGVPDAATDAPDSVTDDPDGRPDGDSGASVAAVAELVLLLREALDGKSQAEQAAAMWQERARNLEVENGRLHEMLALPAHEEEPEPPRRWWQLWRRGGK